MNENYIKHIPQQVDQHYAIWNIEKLINIEKNNENLLIIRKTKKTLTKTTNAPRTNFSRVKSDVLC
jgi:hypothetical protein